ncbi:unnamed protein product, partial [Choristocarpus tenellus]
MVDSGASSWSHTHFDGYDLLAIPSSKPPSVLLLDSSALVLVQRISLENGFPPSLAKWQPASGRTACSSGALVCVVPAGESGPELVVFTPNAVYLSSRVRYSWSCASRVPLSPFHGGVGCILVSWSCQGPLVVADQALSVWTKKRRRLHQCQPIPPAKPREESGTSLSSSPSSSVSSWVAGTSTPNGESKLQTHSGEDKNASLLSCMWSWPQDRTGGDAPCDANNVTIEGKCGPREEMGVGPEKSGSRLRGRLSSSAIEERNFLALAASPCGCMFATAVEGSVEVNIWLRRKQDGSPTEDLGSGVGAGQWNFRTGTVLSHGSAVGQLVWGRGLGNQQNYLLTLDAEGSARVWVEHSQGGTNESVLEMGCIKFEQAALIKAWYGAACRLRSIGFMKWAYFGTHTRELRPEEGTAPGSAYHLMHQQENASTEGARSTSGDSWLVGCQEDGRLLLWSLQDTPLPDGWSKPQPVEVASLALPSLAAHTEGVNIDSVVASQLGLSIESGSPVARAVSAVGYYHSDGRGAPSEVQAVACSGNGQVTVVTARVQRDRVRAKYIFRNVRSVALPLTTSRERPDSGMSDQSVAGKDWG